MRTPIGQSKLRNYFLGLKKDSRRGDFWFCKKKREGWNVELNFFFNS